jgi:hypothetical protein
MGGMGALSSPVYLIQILALPKSSEQDIITALLVERCSNLEG